ncbi:RagB/SusD family nutrient uptake outer membrane protein [Sediminibacterium soli]|uniref:RagB/SusD family nutrient uptake outer membrane protein n=1 Tax=Sediminibacterium soli TaxID=2698829 RepID=UPI001379F722|nr:RagB/SusD family nutrient uptake outer membrane protein [Sediminibacterium soli]NCI46465.1 RagB/SusD family nutrient uptake outer membrane protein [Sediminibacterium soli]
MNILKNPRGFAAMGLAVIAMSFAGCKKNFLDRDPQGRYTSDTYPFPGGSGPYDQYVFAAYASLRDYNVHVTPFVSAISIRSDDADKGSTPADGGADAQGMDNFPVLPSNGMANALWTGYFNLISKCNITIDQIKNNKTIDAPQQVKDQTEGEARFIRGYAYFNLVRLFGRVPLVDKIYDAASQSNIAQSAPAQLYTFIEQDLQFAANTLPVSWDAKFIGRATRGAANGLLTKVYLTQQKWAAAVTAANAVIGSGQYDLSTPYAKIFGEDGENSKESVFEIQATADATNMTTPYGIQYTNVQGVRGTGVWDLGWGWNTPSTQLEGAYETGDPRKDRTILYAGGTTVYGEAVPTGLPNPRYNHKVHTNPSFRNSIGNRFGWWMNVRILRYSDVLLMYAEAQNEAGNTGEALDKLEMVRARARAGNNTLLPKITTTDQGLLRDAIRKERRVELAMEHDRFFDLVRWGIAAQTLQAAGKSNFNNGRDNLMPIPQTQIDLSKGVLTQNPGY